MEYPLIVKPRRESGGKNLWRVKNSIDLSYIKHKNDGSLPFRKRCGFDDVVWWVEVLCGKGYYYKKIYRSGKAVRCLSECYFDMEKI
jgi:hypothetical protein